MDSFLNVSLGNSRLEFVQEILQEIEKDTFSSADAYLNRLEPNLQDPNSQIRQATIKLILVLIQNSFSVLHAILKFKNTKHSMTILKAYLQLPDKNENYVLSILTALLSTMESKDKAFLMSGFEILELMIVHDEKVISVKFSLVVEFLYKMFLKNRERTRLEQILMTLKKFFINNLEVCNYWLEKSILDARLDPIHFKWFLLVNKSLDTFIEVPTRKLFEKFMICLKSVPLNTIWSDFMEYISLLQTKMSDFVKLQISVLELVQFQMNSLVNVKELVTLLNQLQIEKLDPVKKLLTCISLHVLENFEKNPQILFNMSKIYSNFISKHQESLILFLVSDIPEFPNLEDVKTLVTLDYKREMTILFHLNMILYSLDENPKIISILISNFESLYSLAIYCPNHFVVLINKMLSVYKETRLVLDLNGFLGNLHILLMNSPTKEISVSCWEWLEHICKTHKIHANHLQVFVPFILENFDHQNELGRQQVMKCVSSMLKHLSSIPLLSLILRGLSDVDPKMVKTCQDLFDEFYPRFLTQECWQQLETIESCTFNLSGSFSRLSFQMATRIFSGDVQPSFVNEIYKSCFTSAPLHSIHDRNKWLCLELTEFFILNKLKVIGGPNETFETLEKWILLDNESSPLLYSFIIELEKKILLICEKPNIMSPSISSFFISNKRVCEDWFSRFKKEMIKSKQFDPPTLIRILFDRIYDTFTLETNTSLLTTCFTQLGNHDHIEGLKHWIQNVKMETVERDKLIELIQLESNTATRAVNLKLDIPNELKFYNLFQLEAFVVNRYGKAVPVQKIQHADIANQVLKQIEPATDDILLSRCKFESRLGNFTVCQDLISKMKDPCLQMIQTAKVMMKQQDDETGILYLANNMKSLQNKAKPLLFIHKWMEQDVKSRKDFVTSLIGQDDLTQVLATSFDCQIQYAKWLIQHETLESPQVALKTLIGALKGTKDGKFVTLSLLKLTRSKSLPVQISLDEIDKTDSSSWLDVIPQIFAHHNINEVIAKRLILKIGKDFPQMVLYPLLAAKKGAIMDELRPNNDVLFAATENFVMEIQRMTMLWEEAILQTLKRHKEKNTLKNVISGLLDKFPETRHEFDFYEKFEPFLLDVTSTNDFTVLEELLKKFKNQTFLKLNKISLLNSKQVVNKVVVPGMEMQNVFITSFDDQVELLHSKTQPKKMSLLGSDGKKYTFLIKGQEDLRLDARIMQILDHISQNLQISRARHYSVTPLERSGLIQWVNNVTPILSFYKEWFQKKEKNLKPIDLYYKKLIPLLKEKKKSEVLKQVVKELTSETPSNLLANEIWFSSNNTSDWWEKTARFTNSVAVMSIIGYIIGLGDRHLDNILYDPVTSEIIHIDYNICFDKGKELRVPEVVPFRLTPILTNAFGLAGEGLFKKTCMTTFSVAKKQKDTILLLLESFVYDPIVDWNVHDTNDVISRIKEIDDVKSSVFQGIGKFEPINVDLYKQNVKFLETISDLNEIKDAKVYQSQLRDQMNKFAKIELNHRHLLESLDESKDPTVQEYLNVVKRFDNYFAQDKAHLWTRLIKKALEDPKSIPILLSQFESDFEVSEVQEMFTKLKELENRLFLIQQEHVEKTSHVLIDSLRLHKTNIVNYCLNEISNDLMTDMEESDTIFDPSVMTLIRVLSKFQLVSKCGEYDQITKYLQNVMDPILKYYVNGDLDAFCQQLGVKNTNSLNEIIKIEILNKISQIKGDSCTLTTNQQMELENILSMSQEEEISYWKLSLKQMTIKSEIEGVLKQLFNISWNHTSLFEEYEAKFGKSTLNVLHLKQSLLAKLENPEIQQFEEFRSDGETIRIMKQHIISIIKKYAKALDKELIPLREKQVLQMTNQMSLFKNSDEFVKYFELISEYESLSKGKLKEFCKIIGDHKKHMIEYIHFEGDAFFTEIPMIFKEIDKVYDMELEDLHQDNKLEDTKKVEHKLNQEVSKVDSLISHAKSLDYLCQMYEGWMPWV